LPDPIPFGRRLVPPGAPDPASVYALPEPEPSDPMALTPQAEAFRAQLAAEPRRQSEFAEWRASHRGRRLILWALTIVFMVPGLICFALGVPRVVAGGLEIAGVGANIWLRHARRQRLREIAAWEDPNG
jgi:hypothetical protein